MKDKLIILNEGKPEHILIKPIWEHVDKYVFLLLDELEIARIKIISKEQSKVLSVCGKEINGVQGTLNSTMSYVISVIKG